jgi:hypothetical protein
MFWRRREVSMDVNVENCWDGWRNRSGEVLSQRMIEVTVDERSVASKV